MSLPVKLLPAAEVDASYAISWYEAIDESLGQGFLEALGSTIESIQRQPLAFRVVHGSNVRCALTDKFPYLVLFTIESDIILIISVFHTKRNPIVWKGRV